MLFAVVEDTEFLGCWDNVGDCCVADIKGMLSDVARKIRGCYWGDCKNGIGNIWGPVRAIGGMLLGTRDCPAEMQRGMFL